MNTFDVQTVEIDAPFDKCFNYIAEACNLPEWTNAFKSVSDGHALMQTPSGSVEIALKVNASRRQGTIDWVITFPDGNAGAAYSRLVDAGGQKSIYSFVLIAPPAPLERLEGVLEEQSQILREELTKLCMILGGR